MVATVTPAPGGGKPGRRRRRGRAPMAEINVTPFVDVMLVLLIIFMVSAPLLTPGVELELPRSDAAEPLPRPETPPAPVSLDADGRIFYGDEPVTFELLTERLREARDLDNINRVYLRADGSVAYERVADLIARLTAEGFERIGFITSNRPADAPVGSPEAAPVDLDAGPEAQ